MDERAESGMAAHSAYKGGMDYKQVGLLHILPFALVDDADLAFAKYCARWTVLNWNRVWSASIRVGT